MNNIAQQITDRKNEMKIYTYHFRTWSGPNPISDFLASCSCIQNWPYRKTTCCPRRRLRSAHLVLVSTQYRLFLFSLHLHLHVQRHHLQATRPSATGSWLGSWLCSWLSSSGSASLAAFCFLGDVRDLGLQSFFAFLLPIVLFNNTVF